LTAVEKVVSLAALAVVGFGALRIRVVLAAEEFKGPEALHRIYADVNRQAFAGALPDARTDWATLKAPEASGETFFDGKDFIILLDPNNNPTPEEARSTMMHEACHVFTYDKDSDHHGPSFQACKARLQKFGEVR
jgi:SprT-like family